MSDLPLRFPDAARTVVGMATAHIHGHVGDRNALLADHLDGGEQATLVITAAAFVVATHEELCGDLGLDPAAAWLLPAPLPHEPIGARARSVVDALRRGDMDRVVDVASGQGAGPVVRALIRDLVALLTIAAAVTRTTIDERVRRLALRVTTIG